MSVRLYSKILTYPINFFLALAALAIIVLFVGNVIADQYPCWIGVPNCD